MNCQVPGCTSQSHTACEFCRKQLCPAHFNLFEGCAVCCNSCAVIGEPYRARIAESRAQHGMRAQLEMGYWRQAVAAAGAGPAKGAGEG